MQMGLSFCFDLSLSSVSLSFAPSGFHLCRPIYERRQEEEEEEERERKRERESLGIYSFKKKFFAFLTRSIAECTHVHVEQISIEKRCRSSAIFDHHTVTHTPLCAPLGRMRALGTCFVYVPW